MQGDFQPDCQSSLYDSLLNCYAVRKPPAEFLKFGSFSIPLSTDDAYSRSKVNIPKFLFYYICIASLAMVFVALVRPAILLPIAICAAAMYVSANRYNVAGVDLTPQYVTYACIALLVLLSLISTKVVGSYLFMIAFLSISTVISLVHACMLETTGPDHPAGTL